MKLALPVLLALLPLTARAQDEAILSIELNKITQADAACRMVFMLRNDTAKQVESLVYETVLIGKDGNVQLLTLFDFRDAPVGATRVRQFDIPDTQCDGIGQILFNDVHSCKSGDQQSELCVSAARVSSRVDMEVLQ